MKYWILLALITFGTQTLNAQLHWESIVVSGVVWNYFPATSEPPADWMQTGFDDSEWPVGNGGIGYADNDDATVINPVNSLYLRTTFNIEDPGIIKQLLLDIDYEESNLPIIHIDTRGKSIPDEPKIMVKMKVINHSGGGNKLFDTDYEYNAWAGIEIRGSSSQMFEKKNYGLETRDEAGNNLNVSLLGMPEENDWMLHGPFSDKSLMRNALAYHLANGTGRWSPRTRYCELYINDDY